MTVNTWQGRLVAVKRTKITSALSITRYDDERELLALCSDCPNVLKVEAFIRQPPNYCLVLPHYSLGSVSHWLHDQLAQPTAHVALHIACGVARAVEHLHSLGVVHRDIKSDNALLASDMTAVLADFNVAATLESMEVWVLRAGGDAAVAG